MRSNYAKFLLLLLLTACFSFAFAQKDKKYLAQVRLNGKCGFIDVSGNEVVPLVYDDAGLWNNNLVPVNIGKYIPKSYPVVEMSTAQSENVNVEVIDNSEKAGKWGFCNSAGKLVIPVQFTNAMFFNEGMAGVEINDKWGFINTSGKMVVEAVYDTVGYFSQGLAVVVKNGSYGYVNLKGEEVIKLQYLGAEAFEKGLAKVFEKYDSKNGDKKSIGRLINLQGKMVTDAKYDIESNFGNGLASFSFAEAKAENSFTYGLITTTGQVVAQPTYREISAFSNGLALVMVYKIHEFYDEYVPHYGYIDAKGKEVVKPTLAKGVDFSYGMAPVARFDSKDDGQSEYALINTKGEQLLGFNWSSLDILDSKHLLASSIKNPYEKIIIDTKGKQILALGDNGFASLGNGLFFVKNVDYEATAFIGLDKKPLIDLSKNKKTRFISYQHGLLRFGDLDGDYSEVSAIKLGLMDLKGTVVVKPRYNEIFDFEATDNSL